MKRLSLLFIPQPKNNHRALLLQPGFVTIFIALYLLNQSILKSLTIIRPGFLGYSSEITVQKVIDLTNSQRQQFGLPPLELSPTLSQSAQAKAADMFALDYWAHNSSTGTTPWQFFQQVGYQYSVAGENLAKDFYDTDSMIRAWMRSPTHQANIVHQKYSQIGVAVVNGILGGVKTTLVVQHFAAPLYPGQQQASAPPPPAQTQVLAQSEAVSVPAAAINPISVTRTFGLALFGLIIVVLFIDSYFTFKNNTKRLTGSSLGHISFLAIILMLLIFTRPGSIF